jgi:hypothetical protein
MRKKIIKIIESILPRLYDEDQKLINKKSLANHIIDNLPSPERLDLYPPNLDTVCMLYVQVQ